MKKIFLCSVLILAFCLSCLEPITPLLNKNKQPAIRQQVTIKSTSSKIVKMPKIAINEIMFNPAMKNRDHESKAEYIEIYNFGGKEVNLNGYQIHVNETKVNDNKPCIIAKLSKQNIIYPGQFKLIVGNNFDKDYYSNLSEDILIRMPKKSICGILSNSKVQKIILADEQSRLVSSYSQPLISNKNGFSIERIKPSALDEDGNFCFSNNIAKATPAAPNGAYKQGCKQKTN